jgi:uncharacterized protein
MIKDRDAFLASRWLKPFVHLFSHPALWHSNRRSVPRALAIGLFAGFVIPFGQFLLAALVAVPARANVPLAAAATLVTNPFTFGPIYYAAYKVGTPLFPYQGGNEIDDVARSLGATLLQISGPTAIGLLLFAVVAAAVGYVAGALWWRSRLLRRWKSRGRQA